MLANLLNVLGLMATIISLSLCQTSTVSLYLPGGSESGPGELVGSIIASDATATTYAFGCTTSAVNSFCSDFPGVVTLTEGPAIAEYTIPISVRTDIDGSTTTDFGQYQSCSLDTSSAVCYFSASGNGSLLTSTQTVSGTDYTLNEIVITATATSTKGPKSTTSASTITTRTSSGSLTTGAASTGTGTGTGSGSGSGPASRSGTSSSKAAGAVITGAPAWMVGGVAFAFAAMA